MEYLVTGGAGFIGSNIVHRLVRDGKSVRVLDNLATGRMDNIREILGDIDFIEGDIRDAETVRRAVTGVRNVLHLAALPSVAKSVEDPVTTNEVNVLGTLRILVACHDGGIKRLIYSSSSSVYGDTPSLPKQEDMVPAPWSPYAVQKLTGEFFCNIFHELYGLKTYSLRYFNVFGPRQNPKSEYSAVIPLFIEALRNNKPPVIHGDGNQTRDFTFVDDVVRANIDCCNASEETAGEVYNVACGSRTSISDLARILMKIMKKDIEPVHDDHRPGDVRDSQGDTSKALEALGWKPEIGLEEGLKKTLNYE